MLLIFIVLNNICLSYLNWPWKGQCDCNDTLLHWTIYANRRLQITT